jgi:hypothetical protein
MLVSPGACGSWRVDSFARVGSNRALVARQVSACHLRWHEPGQRRVSARWTPVGLGANVRMLTGLLRRPARQAPPRRQLGFPGALRLAAPWLEWRVHAEKAWSRARSGRSRVVLVLLAACRFWQVALRSFQACSVAAERVRTVEPEALLVFSGDGASGTKPRPARSGRRSRVLNGSLVSRRRFGSSEPSPVTGRRGKRPRRAVRTPSRVRAVSRRSVRGEPHGATSKLRTLRGRTEQRTEAR